MSEEVVCQHPGAWEEDKSVKRCRGCQQEFPLFSRKHHCRVCGKIFCSSCSDETLRVQGHSKPQRACFSCYSRLVGIRAPEQEWVAAALAQYRDSQRAAELVVKVQDNKRTKGILMVGQRYLMGLVRGHATQLLFKRRYLFDLLRLDVRQHALTLHFGAVRAPSKPLHLESPHVPALVRVLREAHRDLIQGTGLTPLVVETLDLHPLEPLGAGEAPPPVAGGFLLYYQTLCAPAPPSPEACAFVEDLYAQQLVQIDLQACPAIDGGSQLSFDTRPFFLALAPNRYFRGLVLDRIMSKSLLEDVAELLQHSRSLTRLVIRHMDDEPKAYARLGAALKANPAHALVDLHLSHVQLGRAVGPLAGALAGMGHGLRTLELSACHMDGKGLTFLLEQGLMKNLALALTLEELHLGHNPLGEEGSQSLQRFLLKIAPHAQLKRLRVRKAQLHVPLVLQPLHLMRHLEEVDVAHNKMGQSGVRFLCATTDMSPALKTLDLSGCGLQSAWLPELAQSLGHNRALHSLRLLLQETPLSEKALHQLSQGLAGRGFLYSLDLTACKLTDTHLLTLCEALQGMKQSVLDTLVLDQAKMDSCSKGSVGRALAQLVQAQDSIKCLSLCRGYSNAVLLPLLEGLATNDSLMELRVTGNRLSNVGGAALGTMLQSNSSLVSLACDDNKMLLSAYQSIRMKIKANRTLQCLPFPWVDLSYALAHLPKGKPTLLQTVLLDIQALLALNRARGVHPRFADSAQGDPPAASFIPLAVLPPELCQEEPEEETEAPPSPLVDPTDLFQAPSSSSATPTRAPASPAPASSIQLVKEPMPPPPADLAPPPPIQRDSKPSSHSTPPPPPSSSISLSKEAAAPPPPAPAALSISLAKDGPAPIVPEGEEKEREKKAPPPPEPEEEESFTDSSFDFSTYASEPSGRGMSLSLEKSSPPASPLREESQAPPPPPSGMGGPPPPPPPGPPPPPVSSSVPPPSTQRNALLDSIRQNNKGKLKKVQVKERPPVGESLSSSSSSMQSAGAGSAGGGNDLMAALSAKIKSRN